MQQESKSDPEIPKEIFENQNDKHSFNSSMTSMWLSKRFFVTFLIFLGLVNMNFMKGNITTALVEMTSNKTISTGNQTLTQPAEYAWSSTTKSLVLNMYSYGGLFSFLLSSLPSKLGGSLTYGIIMMMMSILTILIPKGVILHFRWFLVLRFIIGFLENIAFSSIAEIFSRWIPLEEKSRLMSFSYNGVYIGAAFLHSLCGFIAHQFGWSMVFYVTGSFSLAWSLLWLILVPNEPSKDRWISKKELSFISQGIAVQSQDLKAFTPYKSIFTSRPYWALCFSRISMGWSLSVIFSCLPLYVKDATQETTDNVGFISSIPSFICAVLIPMLGTVMDYWKNNSDIQATRMHKIIIGANFFTGGSLLIFSVVVSNFILSISCFTITRTLLSCNALVLLMVAVHMAPHHSGAVIALTTFWYSLGNITAQFIIGVLTAHHRSDEWNSVFLLTSAVMILSGITFTFHGSSEPQMWSKAPNFSDQKDPDEDYELSNK